MPKVSVNILTKNRAELLRHALLSVKKQKYSDYEIIVVNDCSKDDTLAVVESLSADLPIKLINHSSSLGITASRQEALLLSKGKYIAILDDDDEWLCADKLQMQTDFLDKHENTVLVGGGIKIKSTHVLTHHSVKFNPRLDFFIRTTMFFKNNFFNSTVMFKKDAALLAGGFMQNGADLAEDYDLWLRLGQQGLMHNFYKVFALYRRQLYDKQKYKLFIKKQSDLISQNKKAYPFSGLAKVFMRTRLTLT